MFVKPLPEIAENSAEFENMPLVKPTGFREYDARWLFGSEINLLGVQALGFETAQFYTNCWAAKHSRKLLSAMISAPIRNLSNWP